MNNNETEPVGKQSVHMWLLFRSLTCPYLFMFSVKFIHTIACNLVPTVLWNLRTILNISWNETWWIEVELTFGGPVFVEDQTFPSQQCIPSCPSISGGFGMIRYRFPVAPRGRGLRDSFFLPLNWYTFQLCSNDYVSCWCSQLVSFSTCIFRRCARWWRAVFLKCVLTVGCQVANSLWSTTRRAAVLKYKSVHCFLC